LGQSNNENRIYLFWTMMITKLMQLREQARSGEAQQFFEDDESH